MTGGSMSGTLPSIFVPESEKDEAYHKSFVQALTSKSILSGYAERRVLMDDCINFYLGLQNGEEFDFIQKAEDGEVLPAKWMDFNKIAVKIDLLIGELAQRGYKINTKAYNKEAVSRRLEEKNRILTEMRFAPIAEGLEEEFGLPLQNDSMVLPETEKELDIYMEKSYKEKSEIVMRAILSYLRKYHVWDYQRIALFRDLLIMGACFIKNEMCEGYPKLERVDPRFMIWDTAAKDDFLSDSTYWGEVSYMSIGEITKKYDITRKELEDAYKSYTDWNSNQTVFSQYALDFSFVDRSSSIKLFKQEAGELRILVVQAFWQDIVNMNHKYSPDKYGTVHVKKVDSSYAGKDTKKTPIQVWRQGVLIGGKFLKNWGIMKNQDRSVDNIATTTPPYVALVPNYLNGAVISKVHRLRPLQNLKNIALYRLMVEIGRSGGKGFVYDTSQLPKGWDMHTALKYLRTTGVAFIDSSVEGAGNFNQFKEVDMGLSQAVNQYLEISMFLDREMDSVSGVNEARQGLVQGASQAVGVTNSALVQSSLSTHMYFTLFSQLFTKAVNKQAGLAKIAWAGKERFSPIIGDTGINFLEEDIELDLNDYNVFIEEVPPVLADQQMFYQLVMAGVQSGQLGFVAALKLLMEKDLDEAVSTLEMELKRQQMEQQEQMMAEQQAQQQQLMLEEQKQAQQAQQAQQANAVKAQATQIKSQSDLQKILAQGRLDLKQSLVGFKQQLALKKIDAAIQAQKAKQKSKTSKK